MEAGRLVPNHHCIDFEGRAADLWDFRQRSHVLLVYEPATPADERAAAQETIRLKKAHWDWMNVTFLFVRDAPADLKPGAYLIDRFGRLLGAFAPQGWTLEQIDQDLTYYEARHC